MADKDQIVYKLKSAIENNQTTQFDQECNQNIAQIDLYIKVLIYEVIICVETLQE